MAERDRRDDDGQPFGAEVGADLRAFAGRQTGVVGPRVDAARAQRFCQRLGVLARDAVDDRRTARVAADRLGDLAFEVLARQHAVTQLRPVERADEHARITQAQLVEDVLPHARRRRRRVGVERHAREAFAQLGQPAILGPEIVPPLADAVRLVDGERAEILALEPLQELGLEQPFGRYEQEPQLARRGERAQLGARVDREIRMCSGGRDAVQAQAGDLVLHQRDQRRDDHAESVVHERRQLVTQRLAAAGRQHDERVAAVQRRVDRLLLQRPQRLKAEPSFECGLHRAIAVGRAGRALVHGRSITPDCRGTGTAPSGRDRDTSRAAPSSPR
jgi:hypothetical protein